MTRLTDGARLRRRAGLVARRQKIATINSPAFLGGPLRLIRADDGTPLPLPKPVNAADKLLFDPAGTRLLGRFMLPGRGP